MQCAAVSGERALELRPALPVRERAEGEHDVVSEHVGAQQRGSEVVDPRTMERTDLRRDEETRGVRTV